MSNTTTLPKDCAECGKRTNKVNRSEMNPELCNTCYAKAELEVDHQEELHVDSFEKGCYLCNEERNREIEAATDDASRHWIDVHTRRQDGCIACDAVAEEDTGEVDPTWYEGPEAAQEDAQEDAPATKQAHFDHSACDHPKTAKDRAQCRKTGLAAVFHGVISELPSED